jgi:phospholipid/cholesterol/gamma-HCH transport system substrate-binding protein
VAAGTALPNSLQVLATYPFSDAAINAIKGDYLNAFVTTDYNTPGGTVIQQQSFPSVQPAVPGSANPQAIAPPAGLLNPTSSAGPGLPATVTVPGSTSDATAGGGH